MTRPQFQDVISHKRYIQTQHCSHNSSHMHHGSLHPHFKMQVKVTTQVGTQSIVCLSGLELTVKQTQLHFICWYIVLYLQLHELCPNSVCPTPAINLETVGTKFYYL